MTEHEFFLQMKEMTAEYPCWLSENKPYSLGYKHGIYYVYDNIRELIAKVDANNNNHKNEQ